MFRRKLLAFVAPLVLLTAASCTPQTPAQSATVSAAAAAAAAAIQGIILDVQSMATTGGLSPVALSNLATLIASMQVQVTTLLTPAVPSAAPTISKVFDTITALLQQAAAYLPLIMPIIALVGSGAKVGATAITPQQAALRSHYAALKVQSGR